MTWKGEMALLCLQILGGEKIGAVLRFYKFKFGSILVKTKYVLDNII